MAEEDSDVATENRTKTDKKIEYPLEVQYCGGNSYFSSLLSANFVNVVMF